METNMFELTLCVCMNTNLCGFADRARVVIRRYALSCEN